MDIYQLMERANRLDGEIRKLLRESGYAECGDLSSIEYDRTDPEELRDMDELRLVAEKLDAASRIVSYLQLPVVETSALHKNESGRFEMDSGFYFTSGSCV